jgi:hypothetical protein
MNRILPTLLLATTIAGAAVAPAAAADKTGVRKVCTTTYLTVKPGSGFAGTLTKGQTIRVKRYSPSGKYAYGFARGHINHNGWVETADLCK